MRQFFKFFIGVIAAAILIAAGAVFLLDFGPSGSSTGGTGGTSGSKSGTGGGTGGSGAGTAASGGSTSAALLGLWRDGYEIGEDLKSWDDKDLAAVAAYAADWGLAAPDAGVIPGEKLLDHITGGHDATKAGWADVGSPACKVWIARPRASETRDWSGACGDDGFATGSVRLSRKFLRGGRQVQIGYNGAMVMGKAHGRGTTITGQGHEYTGDHKEGIFDGDGVLTLSSGLVFTGIFRGGLPQGAGSLTKDGSVVAQGEFSGGCINLGGRTIAVLRHPSECSADAKAPGK